MGKDESETESMEIDKGGDVVNVEGRDTKVRKKKQSDERRRDESSGGRDRKLEETRSSQGSEGRRRAVCVAICNWRKRRREESSNRLHRDKQVHQDTNIQTGSVATVEGDNKKRRLDGEDRLQKSVSCDSHRREIPKVPTSEVERGVVGVPSDAARISNEPVLLQHVDGGDGSRDPKKRSAADILRRRLGNSWENKNRSGKECESSNNNDVEIGDDDKQEEEQERSNAERGVPRSGAGRGREQDENTKGESKRVEESGGEDEGKRRSDSEGSNEDSGKDELGSVCMEMLEEGVDKNALVGKGETKKSGLGQESESRSENEKDTRENIESTNEEGRKRGNISEGRAEDDSHNRCGTKRGSSSSEGREERVDIPMEVEQRREDDVIELERTEGDGKSTESSEEVGEGGADKMDYRFSSSRGICEESNREAESTSKNGMEDQEMGSGEKDRNTDESSERRENKSCGQVIEDSRLGRLSIEEQILYCGEEKDGNPKNRFIRYSVLNEGRTIRIERVRSNCGGNRCPDDIMERPRIIIRIPTDISDPESTTESSRRESGDDPDYTSYKESEMECNSGGNDKGRDEVGKSNKEGGERKGREYLLQSKQDKWFEVERVELVGEDKEQMTEEGKKLIGSGFKEVDRRKKLRVWVDLINYMKERGCETISPQLVVSYIAKRHYVDGASYDTILGEKSAIMTMIKLIEGQDWNQKMCIKLAIQSVNRLKPAKAKYKDIWDIRRVYDFYKTPVSDPERLRRRSIEARTKAIILIRASVAGRNKDIARISRRSVKILKEGVQFQLYGWKTRENGRVEELSKPIVLRFMQDERICAAKAMIKYMEMNKALYGSMGLTREQVARRTGHRSLNIISFYYDKSMARDIMADMEEEINRSEKEDREESEEELASDDEESLVQETMELAFVIGSGVTRAVNETTITNASS